MRKNFTWMWLLFGLCDKLQVVASLSISEIGVLIAGPIIVATHYNQMRRDGVAVFFWMAILLVAGCAVSCVCNHTEFAAALRGMATTCIIACTIPTVYWLLRNDPGGFKWYIFGAAISVVLCTFIFKRSVEISKLESQGYQASAADVMSGPLFWIERVSAFVTVLPRGWFLQTPWAYSLFAPFSLAAFAMLTSSSGRSSALSAMGSAFLVAIGGKKQSKMNRVGRNFYLLLLFAVGGVLLLHMAYKFSAKSGLLGEDAQKKYEIQTRGGTSIGRLLLGGRAESFAGLFACADRPFVGFGPWAMDYGGYYGEFLAHFGDWDDLMQYDKNRQMGGLCMIPCHSHITEFWLWYGAFGLLFWLYVLFVIFRFLKQDSAAVPQWYFWLVCGMPGVCWNIFFSPFASRTTIITFITACLVARAFRRGSIRLPLKMMKEIWRVENGG